MAAPKVALQITDEDWNYVCMVAGKTQDNVTRNLTELIAKLTGRTEQLPLPAKAWRKEGA